MKNLSVVLLISFIVACSGEQKKDSGGAAVYSRADIQKFRWLEGDWRGTRNGEKYFYEGYAFQSDTMLRILYYTDSTRAGVRDSGAVYLRDGMIYHEADDGLWRVSRIDSAGIHFEPVRNVNNGFSWREESRDSWLATIQNPGAPELNFHMERIR